jgi:hypothetical protein
MVLLVVVSERVELLQAKRHVPIDVVVDDEVVEIVRTEHLVQHIRNRSDRLRIQMSSDKIKRGLVYPHNRESQSLSLLVLEQLGKYVEDATDVQLSSPPLNGIDVDQIDEEMDQFLPLPPFRHFGVRLELLRLVVFLIEYVFLQLYNLLNVYLQYLGEQRYLGGQHGEHCV